MDNEKKIIKIVKTTNPPTTFPKNVPPPIKVIIKKMIKMPNAPIKKDLSDNLPFPPYESPRISEMPDLSDSLQNKLNGLDSDLFSKKLSNLKISSPNLDLNQKLKQMTEKTEDKEDEKIEEKITTEEDDHLEFTPIEQVKAVIQEVILSYQLENKPEKEQKNLREIMKGIDEEPSICNNHLCKFIIFQHKGGEVKKMDDIEQDLMKAIEMLNNKRSELKESKSKLKEITKKNKKLENEMKKLENEVKLMKETSDDCSSQVELYKHQLDFLQKCHEEDQNTIQTLSEKLLSLPQKYESNNGNDDQIVLLLNKTTSQLEEAKNEIKKLNFSKQVLQDKLFEQSNELEKLKKQPNNQQNNDSPKLIEYQKIIYQLQNDKRSLEDSVIDLIKQNNLLSSRQSSNNNVEAKLKVAQNIINELLRERSLVEDELGELYKVTKKK